MNHEIMTWTQVGHFTDWATQAPLEILSIPGFFSPVALGTMGKKKINLPLNKKFTFYIFSLNVMFWIQKCIQIKFIYDVMHVDWFNMKASNSTKVVPLLKIMSVIFIALNTRIIDLMMYISSFK